MSGDLEICTQRPPHGPQVSTPLNRLRCRHPEARQHMGIGDPCRESRAKLPCDEPIKFSASHSERLIQCVSCSTPHTTRSLASCQCGAVA